jgi:hypothetical protein
VDSFREDYFSECKFVLANNISGIDGQESTIPFRYFRRAFGKPPSKIGRSHTIDALEICSMLPFEITRDKTDQTSRGKLTPNLVGTAEQLTDNLKRYRDAGLTMPLLWPPFSGTPTAKTIMDMRRLVHDILPKV